MSKWITILSFTYPHEAHMAKNFLESEGIETFLRDELTAQVDNFYSNAIGGVKLQIKDKDYIKSLHLLKKGGYIHVSSEAYNRPVEIVEADSSTDKTKCPFCGSDNISKKKVPNILTIAVFFVLQAFFPIFKRTFVCHDCEKEWKYRK